MNITRITEEIVEAYIMAYKGEHADRVHKDAEAIPHVPMLTYDFGDETDQQLRTRTMDCFKEPGKVPQTPFDQFRVWIRFPNVTFYGIVARYSDTELVAFGISRHPEDNRHLILRINILPPKEPGEIGFQSRMWDENGLEVEVPKLSDKGKRAHDYLMGTVCFGIEQLCYEYMRPDQHVATVVPAKQGKSVQWVKSRTHYTIVHRKHAANNPNIKKGAIVKVDENAHTLRVAHTRRAHYRVLRSERYKKMKNQRILIKSMWVGPEEWNDGGGQIYRIANIRKRTS